MWFWMSSHSISQPQLPAASIRFSCLSIANIWPGAFSYLADRLHTAWIHLGASSQSNVGWHGVCMYTIYMFDRDWIYEANSTYIAWWLYLKHLVHKVRTHEKKIAAKSAEKKTHTKYPIKKEKGKKAAAATKPRKFWLCHIYTCCMAFLYRHVFVCTVGTLESDSIYIIHINLASTFLCRFFRLAFVLLNKRTSTEHWHQIRVRQNDTCDFNSICPSIISTKFLWAT